MRRLYPEPAADVDVTQAYTDPSRRRHDGRPWLMCVMIASLDGAITIDGRSGDLGGPGDRAVFQALRAQADLILVGAGTARAEGYGPPKKPGQRIGVLTRSGELDFTTPLFTSGAGFVVTTDDATAVPVDSVRAGVGEVDLAAVLAGLDAEVVLCEGGPSLNGQLQLSGLLDEWCLTTAPMLVGGTAGRASRAPTAHLTSLQLVHLLEEDGALFSRHVRPLA